MISLKFLVVIAVGQVPNGEMRSELRQSMGRLEQLYAEVQIAGVVPPNPASKRSRITMNYVPHRRRLFCMHQRVGGRS